LYKNAYNINVAIDFEKEEKMAVDIVKKINDAGFFAMDDDGKIMVAAEGEKAAGDYYGIYEPEYGLYGDPWINPKFEKLINKYGYDYDWYSAGELVIFKD
jgi:hypothetical protein